MRKQIRRIEFRRKLTAAVIIVAAFGLLVNSPPHSVADEAFERLTTVGAGKFKVFPGLYSLSCSRDEQRIVVFGFGKYGVYSAAGEQLAVVDYASRLASPMVGAFGDGQVLKCRSVDVSKESYQYRELKAPTFDFGDYIERRVVGMSVLGSWIAIKSGRKLVVSNLREPKDKREFDVDSARVRNVAISDDGRRGIALAGYTPLSDSMAEAPEPTRIWVFHDDSNRLAFDYSKVDPVDPVEEICFEKVVLDAAGRNAVVGGFRRSGRTARSCCLVIAMTELEKSRMFMFDEDSIEALSISPGGDFVAIASKNHGLDSEYHERIAVTGKSVEAAGDVVRVYLRDGWKLILESPALPGITDVALSDHSGTMYVACDDGAVWSWKTDRLKRR